MTNTCGMDERRATHRTASEKRLLAKCQKVRSASYGDSRDPVIGAIYRKRFWIGSNTCGFAKLLMENDREFLRASRYGNRDIGERRVER